MRINQGRVSNSIRFFKNDYLKKYELIEAFDTHQPVVFFGMYDDQDYKAFQRYKDKIVVVWCGTDSLMINPIRLNILQTRKAIHIVKSKFQAHDFDQLNLSYKIIPVSWQIFNINPVPRGNKIYHYGQGKAYGEEYLHEIKQRTGFQIIKTSVSQYDKETIYQFYRESFIGLRLTRHDGLPNTVIELGMMGRRCIYNGDLPNSISWKNIDDVIHSILHEYKNRDSSDFWNISSAVKEYINIGDKWLYV